jgi:hypothetical protein
MEETIRLWIRDLGFPITVSAIAIYALYKMFMMREQLITAHSAALEKHANDFKQMTAVTAQAYAENTKATKDLSEQMKEICRADKCRAEEVAYKLKHT